MTPVIFRKFGNRVVIALFPTIKTGNKNFIQDYIHVGQHGEADYSFVISKTRLATPEEYKELLNELVGIGYANLKVYKRFKA